MGQIIENARRVQLELMERLLPGYDSYLAELEAAVYPGYRFPWRIAECPAVLPEELYRADRAAMETLLSPYFTPEFRERHAGLVPTRFRRPEGSGWFPRFIATDFQRTEDGDRLVWNVPEIQSFPGNLLLKPLMLLHHLPRLPEWDEASLFPEPHIGGFADHRARLSEMVLGSYDADDTVIVDVNVAAQSTVVDMFLFARHLGIRLVDFADLETDAVTGELTYRRALAYEEGRGPRLLDYDTPVVARNIICRALPDELDDEVASKESPLDAAFLARVLQEPLARGVVNFVVHPHDFFVLNKASLVGNPHHEPALIPVDAEFMGRVRSGEVDLGSGVIKPAYGAGGRGVLGLSGAPPLADILALAERYERRRDTAADPSDALPELHLFQRRYGADAFERKDLAGYEPKNPEEADPVSHELRFLFGVETAADGTVSLELLAGLTRWSRIGQLANARHQKTPFTGTQGILFGSR